MQSIKINSNLKDLDQMVKTEQEQPQSPIHTALSLRLEEEKGEKATCHTYFFSLEQTRHMLLTTIIMRPPVSIYLIPEVICKMVILRKYDLILEKRHRIRKQREVNAFGKAKVNHLRSFSIMGAV